MVQGSKCGGVKSPEIKLMKLARKQELCRKNFRKNFNSNESSWQGRIEKFGWRHTPQLGLYGMGEV